MNALQLPIVQKFFAAVVDPAVKLLFAAAILYFVYGVFTYVRQSSDSASRTDGANHILYSTIGLFIMISVWGIIGLLQGLVSGI
jgi:small-conductance mechanosensitive channel